jgi:hypothetical protein
MWTTHLHVLAHWRLKKNLKLCVCPAPPDTQKNTVLKFSGSDWCLSDNTTTNMKISEENL